ncbi:hypothetical protein CFI09_26160 (plasmid) [Escherichia coli]|nr:hypothetical protein CFI09_26160 [Escherichia coli]
MLMYAYISIRGPLGKRKFSHAKRIELNEWLHPGQLTHSSRQPDGCDLSWSVITVIKTGNIIVFQVVIWPVQLNPVNENQPLKEANFPAMS